MDIVTLTVTRNDGSVSSLKWRIGSENWKQNRRVELGITKLKEKKFKQNDDLVTSKSPVDIKMDSLQKNWAKTIQIDREVWLQAKKELGIINKKQKKKKFKKK